MDKFHFIEEAQAFLRRAGWQMLDRLVYGKDGERAIISKLKEGGWFIWTKPETQIIDLEKIKQDGSAWK